MRRRDEKRNRLLLYFPRGWSDMTCDQVILERRRRENHLDQIDQLHSTLQIFIEVGERHSFLQKFVYSNKKCDTQRTSFSQVKVRPFRKSFRLGAFPVGKIIRKLKSLGRRPLSRCWKKKTLEKRMCTKNPPSIAILEVFFEKEEKNDTEGVGASSAVGHVGRTRQGRNLSPGCAHFFSLLQPQASTWFFNLKLRT